MLGHLPYFTKLNKFNDETLILLTQAQPLRLEHSLLSSAVSGHGPGLRCDIKVIEFYCRNR
jgi:hypothetical protein